MKCPNCGAGMEENSLYCEHCGEDIHIVPDFEPELEFNMEQTLNSIKRDVMDDGTDKENDIEIELDNKGKATGHKTKRKGFFLILFACCAAVLILAASIGGTLAYQYYNSYDYQLSKAVTCQAGQDYDKAIQYYTRALELNGKDLEVRFALAGVYKLKGNKVEYENQLRGIIRDDSASEEQLERAYGKLITIYREKRDYATINTILNACENEKIRTAYQSYLAYAPEFSYPEGSYSEILPLKLSTSIAGRIYYTLDGTEPDENSELYTAPIFLYSGDYIIKTIFINEYGIVSECVTKNYHIEIIQAPAPEISVMSGEYNVPMLIQVLNIKSAEVYYTTDGTVPNRHSTLYTGSIPMPLGKSRYMFAVVEEDGKVGEVTDRRYNLKLNTQITYEDAQNLIVEYMLMSGKIYSEDGSYSTESAGKYLYQYQFATNINGIDDFYVIAEVYLDDTGAQTKTGSYYAVNIYTGESWKLQRDEKNNYNLVEIVDIINESQEG